MSPRPPRILVFASINLDLTLNVDRLPQLGETVLARGSLACPGGKGANQAVAAKRLGAEVGIVCCVGDDLPGQALRAAIEAEGIEIVGWHVDPVQPTGLASINVLPDGQNAIVVASGANTSLSPAHVTAAFATDEGWNAVLSTMESPLAVAHAIGRHTEALACPLILDAGGNPTALRDIDLGFIDILTANETELGCIVGEVAPDEASISTRLSSLWVERCGDDSEILFKRGERGATLHGPFGTVSEPAFAIRALDTVAAGDAHSAAFAVACTEGRSAAETLRFANAAGAIACTRRGAFPAMPTRAEVDKLLMEGRAG